MTGLVQREIQQYQGWYGRGIKVLLVSFYFGYCLVIYGAVHCVYTIIYYKLM